MKKIRKIIEKAAIKVAMLDANSTCSWLSYQPVILESVRKLKKNK